MRLHRALDDGCLPNIAKLLDLDEVSGDDLPGYWEVDEEVYRRLSPIQDRFFVEATYENL